MDAVAFRRTLLAFLGAERFRKFVEQLNRAGRLRFWQEQVWAEFVSAHPEFSAALDEIRSALRICEMHGSELIPETAEVFHGCRDYAQWYIEARNRLFPHAALEPFSTEWAPFASDTIRVWYCPECRAAEAVWRQQRERDRS
jgi:hypothetical protein